MITFVWESFCALLCVVAMLTQSSCSRDSYWVKLSGTVSIGNEWVEMKPKSPLKAEKTYQQIVLDLEPPYKFDLLSEGNGQEAGQGILMPDGDVINPQVELIDQYGNTFNLIYSGATGAAPSPTYALPYPNKLPRDREYKEVRIRSPKPIRCKAIYWFNESSADWK